jgi:tetratricopeptide (TPR) repeat protein
LAEPLYLRALTVQEKALGPKHPEVALLLTNLATQYYDQSRLALAEPLLDKALRIQEESLGPVHPDVAATLNNLAAVAAADGRLTRPNGSIAGVL